MLLLSLSFLLKFNILVLSLIPIFNLPSSGISPEVRQDATIAFDPINSLLFIFGGRQKSKYFNDLWAFSLSNLTWSLIYAQSEEPCTKYLGPRSHSSGFFRIQSEEFCIFGGKTQYYDMSELWCYTRKSLKWESFLSSPEIVLLYIDSYYYYNNSGDYLAVSGFNAENYELKTLV